MGEEFTGSGRVYVHLSGSSLRRGRVGEGTGSQPKLGLGLGGLEAKAWTAASNHAAIPSVRRKVMREFFMLK
jgi:hypothetical protein